MLQFLLGISTKFISRKVHALPQNVQNSLLTALNSCAKSAPVLKADEGSPMKILISSYTKDYISSYANFARQSILSMGGRSKELRSLGYSLKRWTVLSSPFIHKKSRTQLERRTYRREIYAYSLGSEQQKLLVWYLRRNAPSGLDFVFELRL